MLYDSSSAEPVDVQPAIDTATKVARTILQNVATVPASQQKPTLKKILNQIDPTLYDRTRKLARLLKKQGQPADNAVMNALAQSYLNGAATELGAYGTLALAGSSITPTKALSGLGAATAAVLSHDFTNVPATSTTAAVIHSWPYVPVGQNEQVLTIGQVASDGNNLSLPMPLTFPLVDSTIPINSMPTEYGTMLSQVLDQATTFFEPFVDRHQDAAQSSGGYVTCMKGTRFYWQSGVDLSKTPLGPFLPTIDGGHSVPMLRELLQDPYPAGLDSATGNPMYVPNGDTWLNVKAGDGKTVASYPGIPLFLFMYPGTQDTWGIFLLANDIKLDPNGDTYVPEAWADKAANVGPPVTGRLASSSLSMRCRKLDPAEVDLYNTQVSQSQSYANGGCGFSLTGAFTGLGWFLEEIGKFFEAIIEVIADVVEAVVNAIGDMACSLMQQPNGGQALASTAVATGPYGAVAVGVGVAIAKARGCSAPPPPILCPADSTLDPTTGQCAPNTPIALYLLLGAGVLGALYLVNKNKKKKPHAGAPHPPS